MLRKHLPKKRILKQPVPGPLFIAGKKVKTVQLRKNNLDHDSLLHWHGMILPTAMAGVLAFSFCVKPGETRNINFC